MKRNWKHLALRGIKIALGTLIAIVFAELLQLQFPTSAGTIALLTLMTTKTGTVRLMAQRFLTFLVTIFFAFVLFDLIPIRYVAFTVLMVVIVIIVYKTKAEATLSVNALIAIHYLTEQDFTLDFMLNELSLVTMGVVVAFVMNLMHHYSIYESELKEAMLQTESKMQHILKDIVEYIQHPESHSSSWKELGELEKEIQEHMKHALEYDENVFASTSEVYLDYFEMREFQCEILHLLHYEIRKIRHMPKQAQVLAKFLELLILHLNERSVPDGELQSLYDALNEIKEHELPKSHDEFESQAILYHIFMDLEDFLLKEKRFMDRLSDEKRKMIEK